MHTLARIRNRIRSRLLTPSPPDTQACKPLFIIGNTCSGSALLTTMLNSHPEIFITNESDIIWLLYQAAQGRPYACYHSDGPVGMQATLKACEHMLIPGPDLSAPDAVRDLFMKVQIHLMRYGSSIQRKYFKSHLTWIGDGKPTQQTDPEISPFIQQHFPDAKYIHLIRHPWAYNADVMRQVKEHHPDQPMNTEYILERWTGNEQRILDAKADGRPIHTIRYEDLITKPVKTMTNLLHFLGLGMENTFTSHCTRLAQSNNINNPHPIHCKLPFDTREIMNIYGYNQSDTSQELTTDISNEPVRFIIVNAARTGSTMLANALQSHEQVTCHGETFGPQLQDVVGLDCRKPSPLHYRLTEQRRRDPVGFLHHFILDPGTSRAVGLKFKYEELSLPQYKKVLKSIINDPRIHIIHLTRKNLLKRYVSQLAALNVTGIFNTRDEKKAHHQVTMKLDAAECRKEFDFTRKREQAFRKHFKDHPVLEITYEDLVNSYEETMQQVASFLRITYCKLKVPTKKMLSDNLSDIIENYDELKQHFSNTPYASFFQE